jgi:gliding motility-associated-like protein
LECEDPTIYFISPTHVNISAFEIDLYVDQPGSLDDGDVLIFSNLPLNTSYLIIEHQDDLSFTWDGIYFNVGLPDCCPPATHTSQVIPCTGNSNTYTLEGIVDLLPSNPNDSFFLFLDNIPWVQLAHPFDRISWKINGLPPDGATHVIKYFTKDAPFCIQTIQIIAPRPPSPPILQSNSPLCQYDTLLLFSSSSGLKYNWIGPGNFSSTNQNPVLAGINPNQSGTYSVTVTDGQGCTASASIDITITKSDRISLAAKACDSIIINGETFYHSGIYQQVFQNSLGCDSVITLDLIINSTMATGLEAGKDTIVCEGSSIELNGMYVGNAKFNWQSSSGQFDHPDSLLTEYYPVGLGMHEVYLSAHDDCNDLIDSLVVNVLPNQNLSIAGEPVIDPCNEITFTANGSTHYTWTPSEYIECLDSLCSKIRLKSFGQYILTVNADGPCVIPDQLNLSLSSMEAGLFVPNAFTPNGDNINDIFLPIIFCEELQYYHLEIFDRWGNLVFQSFDKNLGWDGRFNSEKMSPAVFVYAIEYQIRGYGRKVKAGDVTLVR